MAATKPKPPIRLTSHTDDHLAATVEYLKSYETAIPSIAGLSLHLGVSRSTVYKWRADDVSPPFSDILDKILATQEVKLMNGGLNGDFNAAIAKLALGKHGYSEKHDVKAGVIEMTQEEWLDGLS